MQWAMDCEGVLLPSLRLTKIAPPQRIPGCLFSKHFEEVLYENEGRILGGRAYSRTVLAKRQCIREGDPFARHG
jgi:hypothetical protein